MKISNDQLHELTRPFGGHAALAAKLGISVSALYNWSTRRMSERSWGRIIRLARAEGVEDQLPRWFFDLFAEAA